MQEINNERSLKTLFLDMVLILKRHLIMILIFIIVGAGIGYAYSRNTKPEYTATGQVVYRAQTVQNSQDSVSNVSAMLAYIDTIMDFCDEGVVLDRANFYYKNFKNAQLTNPNLSVSEFLENDANYDPNNRGKNKDIVKSKISVVVGDAESPFSFYVKYKDTNRQHAIEKVQILVHALNDECNKKDAISGQLVYFAHMNTQILFFGVTSVQQSITTTKTVALFAVIGLVLSLAIVGLKGYFDNTIKSKSEIESITGVSLLATISKLEVK